MKKGRASEEMPLPEITLVTVKQLAKTVPALSIPLIRRLLLDRKKNGLSTSGAIIRVGHRIFLDQGLFMKWIIDNSKRS